MTDREWLIDPEANGSQYRTSHVRTAQCTTAITACVAVYLQKSLIKSERSGII